MVTYQASIYNSQSSKWSNSFKGTFILSDNLHLRYIRLSIWRITRSNKLKIIHTSRRYSEFALFSDRSHHVSSFMQTSYIKQSKLINYFLKILIVTYHKLESLINWWCRSIYCATPINQDYSCPLPAHQKNYSVEICFAEKIQHNSISFKIIIKK